MAVAALFKNTRTLRFKSQQTLVFFAAVNHLISRPQQQFTSTSSKGHDLWFVIGGFQSVL